MKRRQALRQIAMGAGAATASPFYSQALQAAASDDVSPWLKLAVQQYSFNNRY